ncbi:amino acid adenylation domain-containing protein [Sphingomonas sp. IC-56]|uniref:amino acid adenylation domain-containing protein n=1 Tax=Sphingomonas sp. IC-56 TaxID=2898529 RepID=UPI001E353C6A|nr:amino acid adenylation domain-containing protein [Sphingomonas sp. IC-56]MCD2323303.1 amino acid adenylation domain-containing protein [Sphingomonas sp. IC-56]
MQLNMLAYFENGAARQHPDKVAVIDGDKRVTFSELQSNAQRFAALIIARADVLNQPIAVYLPKSAEVVMADLGILHSANFYVNLDVKSPPQRLKNILDNIGPALVVTSRSREAEVVASGFPSDRIVFIDDLWENDVAVDAAALKKRVEQVIDTDPVCIINTSGSTGTPKGVVLSHRGTIDFMDWVFDTFEFDSNTVIGSLSPFYFDIYTLELNVCLAKGATLVIVPENLAIFPAKLMEFLAQARISFLFWVPSIMVNIANLGLLDRIALPDMRRIFFAGEVFPTRHLNMWRRALPQAQFVNLYGPIEIHVDCTYYIVEGDLADDEPLPIGYPCRNSDILILNEANAACQPGEQGELCVRGSSLAMGYWNDPEKTARAFVQNPLNTRYPELIYRTGDLATRRENGQIFLTGRKDFQIKHMGYRIELPEIEHQVLGIEGIANACVVYDHPKKAITLFFEPSGADVPAATIRQALSAVFPKYMLPTAYHSMDRLPMNPNGKIDRNGLVQRLAEAH